MVETVNIFKACGIDSVDGAGAFKSKAYTSTPPTEPGGDMLERPGIEDGIFKTYIPKFIYKPPFGYPRPENIALIRQTSKNPYAFSVIRTIKEEAANTDWEIIPSAKDGIMTPELQIKADEITEFLRNPNGNKESFADILKPTVEDMCKLDSGIWVKVFNRAGKMVQLFARDGGSFVKNPDIFGYIGNREEVIFPITGLTGGNPADPFVLNMYNHFYKNQAAYFQYGFFVASMPIPFGRSEVIWFMMNPQSDSIYGLSPIAILGDIMYTLIYGAQYNLDFYMNNNMPEGVLAMVGAKQKEITAFRGRFEDKFREKDQLTGFMKRTAYKVPIVNRETKFIPFQLSAREMEILSQQEWFTKIVWMCFGITADDMGFTEDSNKAVSESQSKKFARKALKPILNHVAERINMEIIPEFDTIDLKFTWDDYDLDEDLKRHDLYDKQIRMGIKTPEMVAEEEDIDVTELTKQKDEAKQKEVDFNKQNASFNGFGDPKQNGNPDKPGIKSKLNSEMEKILTAQIDKKTKQITAALDAIESGALRNVE